MRPLEEQVFPTVPCMVMSVSLTQAELISILENIQRFNYKPIERARVIEKIVERFGGNKMEAAKALGFKTTTVITDWLAPLEVDPETLRIIKPVDGQTTTRRVTLLASLPKANQKAVAEILNEKASNDIEARKIVMAIKQHPSEDPKVVVERVQTMPQPISVLVQVSPNVNEALDQVALHRSSLRRSW